MVDSLTAAYQSHLKATRGVVSAAVGREWRALQSYNEADIPRFVAKVTPIVSAGQIRAVALTQAYVARKLQSPIVGVDMGKLQAGLRNGVAPAVVYKRPFIRVWTKLKEIVNYQDGDYEDAIQLGQNQAESNADMDIALAMTAAYVVLGAMSADSTDGEIVAWQRVAEPSCCDFCTMLDGVHTGPDQPQPLHNRCGCTAEPITRGSNVTGVDVAPGTTVEDVTIQDHGELGPVITQAGDNFTGPEDIPQGDL